MNIYASTQVRPYVYICVHKETGEFYIGFREKNKLPSHLDLPTYRTSSKKIKPIFDQFNWQVLAEFFDGNAAYDCEQFLIHENWGNDLLLNKACFYNHKRRFKGDPTGIKRAPFSEEHLKKLSEAHIGQRKDTKLTDIHKQKIGESNKGKTRNHEITIAEIENLKRLKLYNTGRIVSNETKEKMRIARTGKKDSAETKEKKRQANLLYQAKLRIR